jgi:hypothetical protein
MKIGELTIPFSTEWKRPRLYRMDMWVANDRTTQAFDGREVWIRDTAGLRTGRDVNPEDRATIIDSAKHFLDQIRLDSRPVVELLGIESLADGKAYKIRLLEENKTERLIYLDTASFLDVRVVRRFLVDGREVQGTMEATAPVWRNGVLFFTRATVVLPTEGGNTEMVMEMETTEVQVNKEIPEQRFLSVKPLPSPSPRDTGTARPND